MLELGPESAAPGSRIAIEAKEDSSYNLKRACEECDEARKNRDAECSLFVWSKRTAPEGTAPLGRYGQDVLVLWDAEDSATDVYFQAGLELVRALALRKQQSRTAAAADFAALDKAINEIEKRAAMLEDMSNWANNIKRDGGKIFDGVQKLKESLEKQIQVLRERSGDLQAAIGGDADAAT